MSRIFSSPYRLFRLAMFLVRVLCPFKSFLYFYYRVLESPHVFETPVLAQPTGLHACLTRQPGAAAELPAHTAARSSPGPVDVDGELTQALTRLGWRLRRRSTTPRS